MVRLAAVVAFIASVIVTGFTPISSHAQSQQGRTAQCIAKCKAECSRRNPQGDSGRMSACMNVCQRNYQC